MKKTTLIITYLLCLSWMAPQAILAKLDLQDGDSFVFLGDSITHAGPYSQYIETFYVTRYPERRIQFMNSGIGGDKAADALARFEEDVEVFEPEYVSVMLGMNDGEYKDFSQEIFGTYRTDMDEVLRRIQAVGAEPILISPTIFDQQQYTLKCEDPSFWAIRLHASDHYNGTMAMYGAWCRESAMAMKLDYINFWGPLNDLTAHQRKTEPQFTFVGDAIHPGAVGHAIMAHAFIEEVEPERNIVSAITARVQNGKWSVTGKNASISNVKGSKNSLSFTVSANSLPWVLPEEARPGYEMAESGTKLSKESLVISGLEPGSYDITINGYKLPQPFTHVALEREIELQANPATPQYQQAAKVALLVKERFEKTLIPYRNLQGKMKNSRRQSNDSSEVAAFRKTIQSELDMLLDQANEYTDKIYSIVQPEELRYVISKVNK